MDFLRKQEEERAIAKAELNRLRNDQIQRLMQRHSAPYSDDQETTSRTRIGHDDYTQPIEESDSE